MTETGKETVFLRQLKTMAGGEAGASVSMYEVGAALGLERDKAAMIAEDLIVDGLVELVNLSGSISITQEGLNRFGPAPETDETDVEGAILGEDPCLDDESCGKLAAFINRYKAGVEDAVLSFELLEEIVMDIKTLEVQLTSSRPKTAIVREILTALAGHALSGGLKQLHGELQGIIGNRVDG